MVQLRYAELIFVFVLMFVSTRINAYLAQFAVYKCELHYYYPNHCELLYCGVVFYNLSPASIVNRLTEGGVCG